MDSMVIGMLIVMLLIFVICRECVCWYFKLTEMVNILKEIRDKE